jgi:sialate O-acetylesterase
MRWHLLLTFVTGASSAAAAAPIATEAARSKSSTGSTLLQVDPILGSDMVLPADNAQLWGTASPAATITVAVESTSTGIPSKKLFTGVAAASGSWAVNTSMPAGLALHNITISSTTAGPSITLTSVLFGAVVICAGQSNMAVTIDDFQNYTSQQEMNVTQIYANAASYARQLRLFTVLVSGKPPIKSAAPYSWGVPSLQTLGGAPGAPTSAGGTVPRRPYFSAECWGTGVALARAHPSIPIGLVVAARGGAAIQSFMSKEAMAQCPHARIVNPPHFGGVSAWWTGMIEPLRYLRPTGVVWHQG